MSYAKNKFFLILMLIAAPALQGKEGMWLPTDFSKLPLAEEGCTLSDEALFSQDSTSLNRAIIGLGTTKNPFRFFCSASFISQAGLVLTNYHCGTRMIQEHSSVDTNIFKHGFWAHSLADELPNEGLTASILLNMHECTDTVMHYLAAQAEESSIASIVDSLASVYEARAHLGANEKISIKSFYEGNKFYALTYRTYKDVRLVGVPPRSIGKFGGDTDNWMWPRHTGDFCILRIYADSAGHAADYDTTNVPVSPERYLHIAEKPYSNGDYSFVMGFPGTTRRYMPADEVRVLTEVSYRERAKIRERLLAVLDARMAADENVYIKYYVRQQGVANYYKNFKGQVEAARIHRTVAKRLVHEDSLVSQMERLTDSLIFYPYQFAPLLDSVRRFRFADAYYREALLYATTMMQAAGKLESLYMHLRNEGNLSSRALQAAEAAEEEINELYANFDAPTEAALMSAGISIAMEMLSGKYRPEYFAHIDKKYKGDAGKFSNSALKSSVFSSPDALYAFLKQPQLRILEKDPIFALYRSVSEVQSREQKKIAGFNDQIRKSKKLDAAQKIRIYDASSQLHYPDANSTLRLTYGHIGGYSPSDARYYKYQTTAKGILEKYQPGSAEFDADTAFISVLKRYEELPVCLISDNDITGGNSGSPLMDARGDIIGLAFDGNWEALSGDIEYLPAVQRCISVDMRYILFVIQHVGQCGHILQELSIQD